MKIELEFPFNDIWQAGYIVTNKDNRKMVCGFVDQFEYADKSKVIVELEEVSKIDKILEAIHGGK